MSEPKNRFGAFELALQAQFTLLVFADVYFATICFALYEL